MKLSLSWIFDHINADLAEQNIDTIVSRFNEVSAEIDGVHRLTYDLSNFFVGTLKTATPTSLELFIPELNATARLPVRSDADRANQPTYVYLVKKTADSFSWVTHVDFGQERDTLAPLMSLELEHHNGAWRKLVGETDVLLDVDNKTITHRPDMWGHRGFAREIAAFMNLPFKDISSLTTDLASLPQTKKPQFTCEVTTPNCKRFVLAHFSSIKNNPSDFKMAFRIMRIGMRAFNALVDLTNYTMLDWSQPSHAYDATKIEKNHFIVRNAHEGEEIIILDGSSRTLCPEDMIIASPSKFLCLAGIKGGQGSGISDATTSLVLESATFDATAIRKTAFRTNLRTEAAARFEKTLSTEQPVEMIARFIYLAKALNLDPEINSPLIDIRQAPYKKTIVSLLHSHIERKMGITLPQEQIVSFLSKLEFKITATQQNSDVLYSIEIPHWRASKDIAIPEDIIEEIARMYGFNSIPLSLPVRSTPPACMTSLIHERSLKRTLAQAGLMEQKNYLYYDKRFTDQINLDTDHCLTIINPVSDQLSRLAESLIPGLLKNVEDNVHEFDDLSFFEINATWKLGKNGIHEETQRLAGIFFSRRSTVNFFEIKALCSRLFSQSNVFDVAWKTDDLPTDPWVDATQHATIWQGSTKLGSMGFVKQNFLKQLTGVLPESTAIVFDLDYEILKNPTNHIVAFKPISRYQANYFDISLLVPPTVSYAFITQNLSSLDPAIAEVRLLDSFSKKDWAGKRSLTFRCKVIDHQRTMTREDIDAVYTKVVQFSTANNLTIRE